MAGTMIIRRYLYREIALAVLAVTAVLVVLFVLVGVTKLLGQAAVGQYPRDIVLTLLGLELVRRLEILIPLAMYVAILLTLARWYRDNEMTILAACGMGLTFITRPVMQLALGTAVVVAVFALYVSPLATAKIDQTKKASLERTEISVAAPGVFTDLRSSGRILYVERIGTGGVLEKIFVNDHRTATQNVLAAKSGYQRVDSDTGARFLVLKNGSMYEGIPGEPDYRVVEFATYTLRLEAPRTIPPPTAIEARPTSTLLGSSNHRENSELHWRLAKPVSVLVLAIFALVLAHTDARRGRITNLIAAILVYFTYTNLLGVGETLLKSGRVAPAIGLW
ncbi:MAG: LPS export ABC transporter permease LptF, partial [Acidiferrobacterales bacterium]|nr:LPS export ABC transporter permease LptF [Acidiferrobacterales bacterium]